MLNRNPQIILPNNWEPRFYQKPVFAKYEEGIRRFLLKWHRRGGKDDTAMHFTAERAHEVIANYWHLLPEYAQAKKSVWEAVNPHTGVRRIDEAFPLPLRKRTNNTEMLIEFKNGSTWQLVGADSYNKNVGSTPYGVIFSEFALSDPNAWNYVRPMLQENGGWAMFISSVRGRNHFWKLGELAKNNPKWFYSEIAADESGVFTAEQLTEELAELIELNGEDEGRAIYLQEYFNDPNAAVPGAYYAKLMTKAESEGRICFVPHNPAKLVHTAWDIGVGDSTAIWFFQHNGAGVDVIDYLEGCGVGADWYAQELRKKPYTYSDRNIFPHDIEVREWANAKTRLETLAEFGIRGSILPKISVDEGISAVRQLLPRCRFDREKCKRGLECLTNYHKKWDEKNKIYQSVPYHDWSSHAADSFRYLALGFREERAESQKNNYSQSSNQNFNYDPLSGTYC